MNKSELKASLHNLSKDRLVSLILDLRDLTKVNQDFLNNIFVPTNEDEIFQNYQKIVKNEFFPERGDPKLRYSILRTAINEFKKISRKPSNIASLMLFYVENGVKFTNEYGDIDERFYYTIANIYKYALDYIFKNKLEKLFMDRCHKIVIDTDEIGWGFHDYLSDLFYAYYENYLEM